ncbi:hypothetical protein [Aquabacterium sp.]|uniref:hypothetical protein n=1 Tax=Aquabacterium sp. TaxID=1872578 RepID=UPI002488B16B|nr:hypothetical protein [Aquabacterium sp.]MDI1261147.1 hypothetical protein [Aquabacterium sp.]
MAVNTPATQPATIAAENKIIQGASSSPLLPGNALVGHHAEAMAHASNAKVMNMGHCRGSGFVCIFAAESQMQQRWRGCTRTN